MNRTRIEWCDFTWNPVTGCWGPGGTAEKSRRCDYCYAVRVARRFTKDQRLNNSDPFMPRFWEDRLSQPAKVKKPSRIFVGSMADLFGDWVPDEWIEQIKVETIHNPHHTFQFLTKNPKRLKDFNPWPANCWVGTTVTNQEDADERIPELLKANAVVRFMSVEPILSAIEIPFYEGWYCARCERQVGSASVSYEETHDYEGCGEPVGPMPQDIHWLIIGAQTGPGAVKPDPVWVQSLIDQYRAAGTPIFLKENLKWPENIQELPEVAAP